MLSKRILTLIFAVAFLTLLAGCIPPPTNQVPIITSTPTTTATVGVAYAYNVNATDPDGDTLIYSLDLKPSGMTINSANGLIKWTPTAKGDNPVVVKVSDGSLSITQSFTIKVSTFPAVNQAPVIYSSPITTATVGVTYVYDVNATDPDGDTLTYSLTTKPSGMSINPANGLIWWIPTTKGSYAVVVNASDGVLSDAQLFTIVVSKPTPIPVNHEPVIYSTPSLTAIVGVKYTYTINAIDPDGDAITYSLVSRPTGMTFDGIATISWTPVLGQVGSNGVTVKASDGVLSDTQSFTIVVSKPSVPTKTYTITATAGTGGSITPLGVITVDDGSDKLFTFTPDSVFYGINYILVDGDSVGAEDSYTFGNVTEDHTIEARFILLGRVYNQTEETHHDTIQGAIDGAIPDNTILVSASLYEGDVAIDIGGLTIKSVEKHGAIIKGSVEVGAEGVTLEGFIIRNAGWNAISLTHDAHNCVIVNNVGEYSFHDGLWVFSDGNEITDNEFKNNGQWGIFLSEGDGNIVKGNTLSDNAGAGLGFYGITDWTIEDNSFKDNDIHVWNQAGSLTIHEMKEILDNNIFPDGKAEVVSDGEYIQDIP